MYVRTRHEKGTISTYTAYIDVLLILILLVNIIVNTAFCVVGYVQVGIMVS